MRSAIRPASSRSEVTTPDPSRQLKHLLSGLPPWDAVMQPHPEQATSCPDTRTAGDRLVMELTAMVSPVVMASSGHAIVQISQSMQRVA